MNKRFIDHVLVVSIAALMITLGGCALSPNSSNKAAEEQTPNSGKVASNNISKVHRPTVSLEEILPHQKYNSDGSKIPYVKQPNPYFANRPTAPQEAQFKFNQANRLLVSGKTKEARKEYKALTRKYENLSGPWVKLAEIAKIRDEFSSAIDDYEMALKVNPDNMGVYLDLALLYREQGRFDDAKATYYSALKRWPDFAEAHYNAGVFFDLYMNDALTAQKHFQAYYFLTNEKNETVRKWLVELQRRSGDERNYVDSPPEPAPAVVASKS